MFHLNFQTIIFMKIKTNPLLLFFLLFVSAPFFCLAQNCDSPYASFEFVGSSTDFCEGPKGTVTVDITTDQTNDPACIKTQTLFWGDGKSMVIPPGNFGNFTHNYFYEDSIACKLTLDDLNPEVKLVLDFTNGKRNTRTQSIKIRPLPRALIGFSGALCIDKPVVFTAGNCWADSVVWLIEGKNYSAITQTITFDKSGWKTVSLVAMNDCDPDGDTASISIFIKDRPLVNSITDFHTSTAHCLPPNDTVRLTASVNSSTEGFLWKFEPLAPPCSGCWGFLKDFGATNDTAKIWVNKPGKYLACLTASNDCNYEHKLCDTIEFFTLPTVAAPPQSGCDFLDIDFSKNNAVIFGGSITNYDWKFPDGTTSTEKFPVKKFTQSGTVQLKVSGPCGSANVPIPININKKVPVQFGSVPSPLCASSDTFSIPILVSQNPHTFSGTGIANAQTGLFDPKIAGEGKHLITYSQGVTGCQTSATIEIEVLKGTEIWLPADQILCIDDPVFNPNFLPSGGTWTGTGVIDPVSGAFNPAVAGANTHSPTYEYQDPQTKCFSKKAMKITVVALPKITAPLEIPICKTSSAVDLNLLGNFGFSPTGGSKTFTGAAGLTPDGKFTAPDTGSFQIKIAYSVPPGCDTFAHFWVKVSEFTPAAASPLVAQVCNSQQDFTFSGTPTGGEWSAVTPGAPPIGKQTGTVTTLGAAVGTFKYRYQIHANTTCASEILVELKIENGQGVSVSPAEKFVCETENLTPLPPAQPAGSGQWSGDLPLVGNQIDLSNAAPGDYNFRYTVATLPAACNAADFVLHVAPQVNPNFSIEKDTACIGNVVQFFPATAADPDLIFEWNFGDSQTSNLHSPSHAFASAGDFDVVLILKSKNPQTGATLCQNVFSKKIHVIRPPEKVAAVASSTAGCAPFAVKFTNESIAENAQFFWDFGNGQTHAGIAPPDSIRFEQGCHDTTYLVKLTLKNGCEDYFFEIKITVKPRPVADIRHSIDKLCSGADFVLTNSECGDAANVRWQDSDGWSFVGADPPVKKYFAQDSFARLVKIWVTATNGCGTASDTLLQTVHPTDVFAAANVSDTTRVCVGDTVFFKNIAPHGTHHWTVVGSVPQHFTTPEIAHLATSAGWQTVILYVEGCGFDSLVLRYFAHPLPEIAVEAQHPICDGSPVKFLVKTGAGNGTVLRFGTAGDSTFLQNVGFVFQSAGTFFPSATATSPVGCRSDWSGEIEVLPRPDATLALPDSVCSRTEIELTNPDPAGNTCVFVLPDGQTADGCSTTWTFAVAGSFAVRLVEISPDGCRDTAVAPVYVRETPHPDFSFQILEKCTPARVLFTSAATGATGIFWRTSDGATAKTASFEHIFETGGEFEIWQVVSNEGICSDSVSKKLKVFQTPVFDFEFLKNCTVAEGTDLLVNTPTGNWTTVEAANYPLATGDFHAGLQAGFYKIKISTAEGCTNDTAVNILPINELRLKVEPDSASIRLGEQVTMIATPNKTGVKFKWQPAADLLDPDTLAEVLAKPSRTTLFRVVATDAEGCSLTDLVFVRVLIDRDSAVGVPNAFTPNGDGFNDFFKIRNENPGVGQVDFFRIWDKWGELMYEKSDFQPADEAGWDGSFRGKKAEQGAYLFHFRLRFSDGEAVERRGELLLIR